MSSARHNRNPIPKRVAYIYPYAFQYRREFHEELTRILAGHNVEYEVIYCENPHFADRGDFAPPSRSKSVRCTYLNVLGVELRYQHALRLASKFDLVILQQENGLLLNYPLQMFRRFLGIRVAFFGHGRNFQSNNPNGIRERFKRYWTRKVDWWFAYTSKSADLVEEAGFDPDRISTFNNAIDTSSIVKQISSINLRHREAMRRNLFDGSQNIGIYVGALYKEKRIRFLIEAAKLVRAQISDFHLLIIGGGPDSDLAAEAAAKLDWIHWVGPKFGAEKSLLVSQGKVLLMPGLVGLAVLDSFAYGLPMVTTDVPFHSPEIEYLKDDQNGVVVRDIDNLEAYAAAVIRVLADDRYRARLIAGGMNALNTYTIENMALRFADGVMKALG